MKMLVFSSVTIPLRILLTVCLCVLAGTLGELQGYSITTTSGDGTVKAEKASLIDGMWVIEGMVAKKIDGKPVPKYYVVDNEGLRVSDKPIDSDGQGRFLGGLIASMAVPTIEHLVKMFG